MMPPAIPEKLDAQLEALARRGRVSKSTIVRQALEQQIRRARKVIVVMTLMVIPHAHERNASHPPHDYNPLLRPAVRPAR